MYIAQCRVHGRVYSVHCKLNGKIYTFAVCCIFTLYSYVCTVNSEGYSVHFTQYNIYSIILRLLIPLL